MPASPWALPPYPGPGGPHVVRGRPRHPSLGSGPWRGPCATAAAPPSAPRQRAPAAPPAMHPPPTASDAQLESSERTGSSQWCAAHHGRPGRLLRLHPLCHALQRRPHRRHLLPRTLQPQHGPAADLASSARRARAGSRDPGAQPRTSQPATAALTRLPASSFSRRTHCLSSSISCIVTSARSPKDLRSAAICPLRCSNVAWVSFSSASCSLLSRCSCTAAAETDNTQEHSRTTGKEAKKQGR